MKKVASILAALFLLNASAHFVTAEPTNAELLKELKALKKRVAELEAKIQDREPEQVVLQDATLEDLDAHIVNGLKMGASSTFVVQGTVDANNVNTASYSSETEDVIDGSYSVALEIEKEFGDYGMACLGIETGDGPGVEDELEVFSNVNRDADDSDNALNVVTAFYEHYLFDNQLTLTAGKLDPTFYVDQNKIANDECGQFLGRIFRNASTIDFSDNNAGLHFLLTPEEIPLIELEAQALDGDGDWEDIADNIFATAQINIKPKISEDLDGNYRAYIWYKDIPYTKWSDPSNFMDEYKYGFGASIDQEITDILTIFGRYGWTDPDLYDPDITSSSGANYSLEHTYSAGLQINGGPWGRKNDHLAIAAGMAIPSDDYRDAGTSLKADDEGHAEVYYSCQVNEHLTLSPDVQVIWNPFGGDYIINNENRDTAITVVGCRGQVDF